MTIFIFFHYPQKGRGKENLGLIVRESAAPFTSPGRGTRNYNDAIFIDACALRAEEIKPTEKQAAAWTEMTGSSEGERLEGDESHFRASGLTVMFRVQRFEARQDIDGRHGFWKEGAWLMFNSIQTLYVGGGMEVV